jgi:hypothetical protein
MNDDRLKAELDALLREHGGLEGLARELGQFDPPSPRFEPPANENTPSLFSRWWRLIWRGRPSTME